MAATRNETIEIMKGIGITLVIIGHMQDFFELHKFIFIFHMPLFFIFAGYFFSSRGGEKVWQRMYVGFLYLISRYFFVANL